MFTRFISKGNKVQLVIFKVITIDTFVSLLCSQSEVIQMFTTWLLFHLTIAGILFIYLFIYYSSLD